MLVLITYDVNVTSKDGQSRLHKVAKICLDYGMRVQNSVFECEIDPAQFALLKSKLLRTINPEVDSLRFYFLGKKGRKRIEHVGAKLVPDPLRSHLII
ncbi:CRISPR-associated endoribonuclease Cas2 [Legionella birminghamensis]|uniref:CRISPR-associated endoribonuclease Cas2 n=1 Tax=Legionella birminghamensis TaxID=28083 RepID=A0A378I9V0_9GAMM|nr:CRISPR-associated endonuclease Cas2 [Legionella birminghamensis]KTC70109.1 CRISPR-associated endoribonuclease Cas2 [Legionella birminghamensis]STX31998.1 CRISPR-associated endoribonuclease Cas2 [Legionella birminghamensis]